MRTVYHEADDILVIRLADKHIVRETSRNWNTHISYAEDGTIVEVVILEASKQGAWPLLRECAAWGVFSFCSRPEPLLQVGSLAGLLLWAPRRERYSRVPGRQAVPADALPRALTATSIARRPLHALPCPLA